MARLMILEPHSSGHRMQYVRWISKEAVARGHAVQIATSAGCLDHPLYLATQRECQERVQTLILPGEESIQQERLLNQPDPLRLARRELTYHRLYSEFFRRLSDHERPDFVFVSYLDYCTYAIALLRSPFGATPWGGIVMRPSFHLRPMGIQGPHSRLHWAKKRLFFRLLRDRTLRVLFSIDEALVQYVGRSKPSVAERLRFLPEPTELRGTVSRDTARRMLNIPKSVKVVLVYGSLTMRKGIDALLLAAQERSFPPEVHILLAGPQDSSVTKLLASPQARKLREVSRLHEHNRFLSGEDEYAAFQAADIVWLGYKKHYTMSAVLVQAGVMGLPVVACTEGLIGWSTREHELGFDVSVDDSNAIAEAIATLARAQDVSVIYGANGAHFAASHTSKNFGETITDVLSADRVPAKRRYKEIS